MVSDGEQGHEMVPTGEPGDEMVPAAEERDETVSAAEFLDRLVARLSTSTGVSVAYGEPIERHGVTIIPVAKIGFGFGAGTGSGRRGSEAGRGGGGGGGAGATPIGYIEIKDGNTAFRPIHRPARELLPPVAAFVAGAVLTRILRRARTR